MAWLPHHIETWAYPEQTSRDDPLIEKRVLFRLFVCFCSQIIVRDPLALLFWSHDEVVYHDDERRQSKACSPRGGE